MNKKKILTSLALAGVLTAGVIGANVKASTNDNGIFNSLVNNHKNVVPYVVAEGNSNVTIADIVKDFGGSVSITSVKRGNDYLTGLSSETVISTGDEFKIAGTTYTALVYGDVNKDGEIDAFDAKEVLQYSVGNKTLDALAVEAADVDDPAANEVDAFDAKEILKFGVGTRTKIGTLPSKEEEKDVVSDNYTLTVANDNVIAHTELTGLSDGAVIATTKAPITITLDKALTTEQFNEIDDSKIYVDLYGTDNNGKEIKVVDETGVTVAANTVKFEGNILVKALEDNMKDENDELVVKSYTAKIRAVVDGETVILGKTTFTYDNNVTYPAIIAPVGERTETGKGTVTFESIKDHEFTRVYYSTKGAISYDNIKDKTDAELEDAGIYYADAKSGKATVEVSKLTPNTVGTVHYYLLNKVGNTEIESASPAKIPADVAQDQLAKPTSVEYDEIILSNQKEVVYVFTYENSTVIESIEKYNIQLLDSSKSILAEQTISKDDMVVTANKVYFDLTGNDDLFTVVEDTGAGKYYIKVIAVADGFKNADAVTSSKALELTQLDSAKVSYDVVKDDDENEVEQISFKYADLSDVKDITIDIKAWNKADMKFNTDAISIKLDVNDANSDGKIVATEITEKASGNVINDAKTTYEDGIVTVELIENKLNANVLYRATFTATSNNGLVLYSDEQNSDPFFRLNIADADLVLADTTGTLKFTPITVEGYGEVEYSVEAVKIDKDGDDLPVTSKVKVDYALELDDKGEMKLDNDGKATINLSKLSGDTTYGFRLNGTVNQASGKSGWVTGTTVSQLPEIDGLAFTVDADKVKTAGYFGTGYIDGTKLKAEASYDSTKYTVYKNLLAQLNAANEGTVVTVKEVKDKLDDNHKYDVTFDISKIKQNTLALAANKFNTFDVTIIPAKTFAATVTGTVRNLTVESSDYTTDISGVSINEADIDNTLSGVQTGIITLKSGANVKVKDNAEVMVSAGTVTINGYEITTAKDIKLVAKGKVFTIATSADLGTLKFAKTDDIEDIEVKFDNTDASAETVNAGKIEIDAKGDVKITNGEAYVKSDIKATITDGSIDLSDAKLTGSKDVTLVNSKNSGSTSEVTGRVASMTKEELEVLTKLGITTDDGKNELAIINYTRNSSIITAAVEAGELAEEDVDDAVVTLNGFVAKFGAGLSEKATITFNTLPATIDSSTTDFGKVTVTLTKVSAKDVVSVKVTNLK